MENPAEELVTKWVKSVKRDRSGRIIANLFANGYVATLENLLRDIDKYVRHLMEDAANDNKVLSEFKADYENIESELNKTTEDKRPLVFYLKPSGKKKNRWLRTLKELYKLNLDSSIDEVIEDMIKNRQTASHTAVQNQPDNVWGEQLKLWHLATLYLTLSLILAVHERLKSQT
jgi:hypothetical protein